MTAPDKYLLSTEFKSLQDLERFKRLALWLPVNIGCFGKIPWGYKKDSLNPIRAIPIEEARVAFIQAVEYLKTTSYAEVAEWLASLGFPIEQMRLRKLFSYRPVWKEIELPYEEREKLCRTESDLEALSGSTD